MDWKPDRYPDVSPYIIATDARRVLEFLRSGFGARELRSYEDESGGLIHAEMAVGDSVVMVADTADGWPPVTTHVHVYVPDVDATFAAAVRAGGEPVQQPGEREGDPDRRGGVRDPVGNVWWISTQKRGGST